MYDIIYSISNQTGIQENMIAFFLVMAAVALFVLLKMFLPEMFKILPKPKFTDGETNDEKVDEFLDSLGYSYDEFQDIFFSELNSWQREMGYCRLYDEAAALFSMIIDCEPVYFEYDNKRWMIEFWKGQYGMTTGCEIGVYSTDGPDLKTDFFNGTFYESAGDDELLKMSFVLFKNGQRLFERYDLHWWLTGFKLGEFSNPEELSAVIEIRFADKIMRNEFIKGLKEAGYYDDEIYILGNTVGFLFDKPRTEQPFTRNEAAEGIMQSNNKELCDRYQAATKDYDSLEDKIDALRRLDPDLINELLFMGKNKSIFDSYKNIKKYL